MKKDSYVIFNKEVSRVLFDSVEEVCLNVLNDNCSCGISEEMYDKKDETFKCKNCFIKENLEFVNIDEMVKLISLISSEYSFFNTTESVLDDVLGMIECYNIYASNDEIELIQIDGFDFCNGIGTYNMLVKRSNGQSEIFESNVFNTYDELFLAVVILKIHFDNIDNTFYKNTEVKISL